MRGVRFYLTCTSCMLLMSGFLGVSAQTGSIRKGQLIYENALSGSECVTDWVMEGPGKAEFREGWMQMYAPDQAWHHVFWCPEEFPSRFIAEWEVKNLNADGGLLIVFFAARGVHGEDIFDPALPERDGTFRHYTREQLNSYHISYYANNPKNPDREFAHLRKNTGFALVYTGTEGIPKNSTAVHKATLIKDGDHILFYIDDKKVIEWRDDGTAHGPVHGAGKIGFRQMQWSRFAYRNFKVWTLKL